MKAEMFFFMLVFSLFCELFYHSWRKKEGKKKIPFGKNKAVRKIINTFFTLRFLLFLVEISGARIFYHCCHMCHVQPWNEIFCDCLTFFCKRARDRWKRLLESPVCWLRSRWKLKGEKARFNKELLALKLNRQSLVEWAWNLSQIAV